MVSAEVSWALPHQQCLSACVHSAMQSLWNVYHRFVASTFFQLQIHKLPLSNLSFWDILLQQVWLRGHLVAWGTGRLTPSHKGFRVDSGQMHDSGQMYKCRWAQV